MRALVQRVRSARVEVAGQVVGAIDRGLLGYVGFGRGDSDDDRAWVISKLVGLRIFDATEGASEAGDQDDTTAPRKMALSVRDVGGAVLLVSQFTLYGDLRRGRRPSFDDAMPSDEARAAYESAVREARSLGVRVETGRFQAEMLVHAVVDGPVTLWIDSAERSGTKAG